MKVTLGKKYKEKIHGRTGIATARNECLGGRVDVLLERMGLQKPIGFWALEELLVEFTEAPAPEPGVCET